MRDLGKLLRCTPLNSVELRCTPLYSVVPPGPSLDRVSLPIVLIMCFSLLQPKCV